MDNCITVRGKSYPVAMTVQAFAEIGDLCPGKDYTAPWRTVIHAYGRKYDYYIQNGGSDEQGSRK